ncbi:MAG: DUF1599 domain-containing protein [Bacteroidales bacterium]|nr:DUF1599 domain-containing protein [Bacteroidales bacterium]
MSNTELQYKEVIAQCKNVFIKKMQDYGTAWRIMRPSSITDQIYIKAKRIRTLQTTEVNKVGESQESEFIGIINYAAMALIQLELGYADDPAMDYAQTEALYDEKLQTAFNLMMDKNHDYGEAWREMRVESITDLILMKIHRTKEIEDHNGKTIISEGIDANYNDMINYAVFAMILLSESNTKA